MQYIIYPKADATIYDKSEYMNTGLDEILELEKTFTTSSDGTIYNSRILMKFDVADILNSIPVAYQQSASYYLKLYAGEATEIPLKFQVDIYAVSQSWEMGYGREYNDPVTTTGVSWVYRDTENGYQWQTGSYAIGTTGSYTIIPGGATWYTGFHATHSYEYENSDIDINVTSIVSAWVSGTIQNDGFIIKLSGSCEVDNNDYGNFKYFSTETHTIYRPCLYLKWNDYTSTTGSLISITDTDDYVIYSQNMLSEYNTDAKARIRINIRDRYPVRTYSTESAYLSMTKCLPTNSFYQITDEKTSEIIIPFDETYTKINCDANGNYIDIWMGMFEQDRYYNLWVKSTTENNTFIKNGLLFKVKS